MAGGNSDKVRRLVELVPDRVPAGFSWKEFKAAAKDSNIFDTYEHFKTGGKYDFKKNGHPEYADFGNWAAGAYAKEASWLGVEGMKRAAGCYQKFGASQRKNYKSEYGSCYNLLSEKNGDDPLDTQKIGKGGQASDVADEVRGTQRETRAPEPKSDWVDPDAEDRLP